MLRTKVRPSYCQIVFRLWSRVASRCVAKCGSFFSVRSPSSFFFLPTQDSVLVIESNIVVGDGEDWTKLRTR